MTTAYLFRPPYPRTLPPFLPDSPAETIRLWRHYIPRRAGANVFKLNNGSFVQTIATPARTDQTITTPPSTWTAPEAQLNPNVPYPWNADYPNDPYVHIQNWTGSVTTVTLTPRIEKVYWGGHDNIISASEYAALTAAGYGYCMRAATPTEIPDGWSPTDST